MLTLKQVAQQALEALEQPNQERQNQFNPDWDAMAVMVKEGQRMAKRIEELEAALEQQPVAWLTDRETLHFDREDAGRDCDGFIQPLYTKRAKLS